MTPRENFADGLVLWVTDDGLTPTVTPQHFFENEKPVL